MPLAPTLNDPGVTLPISTNFTLSWSAIEGAIGYHLQIALDAQFINTWAVSDVLFATSANISHGVADTYYYRVRAINDQGIGGWSNVTDLEVVGPRSFDVPGDFASLDDALAAAESGDTVNLGVGNFNFDSSLLPDNSITIEGAGPGSTYIAVNNNPAFRVEYVRGITFSNLTIRNSGTADELGGGMYIIDSDDITISNCRIENNLAAMGGGIYISDGTDILIKNTLIVANHANISGGAAYITGNSDVTFENVTIADNTSDPNDVGGIVMAGEPDVTVINSIIWNNTNGGFYVTPGSQPSSSITYTDISGSWTGAGNISANPLFIGGGDYHLQSRSSCINAGNPTYAYSNEPEDNGDRINIGAYGNTSDAAVKVSSIWNIPGDFLSINDALDSSTSGDTIEIDAGNHLHDQTIELVGGITITGDGMFDTTVVNTSQERVFEIVDVDEVTISDIRISSGGNMFADGGGIYIDGSSNITINNCQIETNTAKDGAGIYIKDSENVLIKNCIFHRNTGSGFGGAIYIENSDVVIESVTIADNMGMTGGVYVTGGSTVTMKDSIVWNNGDEINVADLDSSVNITYSDLNEPVVGTGNLMTNPFFVNSLAGDYHLLANSPCIDAGDPASNYTNEPEDNGDRINMGAYGNTSSAVSKPRFPSSPFIINFTTSGWQSLPVVAADDSGDYVVVWTSDHEGSTAIYAQRYNSSGVAQGVEFQVNVSSGIADQPAVAMDDDGNFVVVWEKSVPMGFDIYARLYNSAGVAQGSEFRISDDSFVVSTDPPAVAIDASGNFVVVWTSDHEMASSIYARRYNSSGVALGAQFMVSGEFIDNSSPSVAMDNNGDFVVVWKQGSVATSLIYAQRYNSSGVAQGAILKISGVAETIAERPAVAMDSSGDFIIVWEDIGQDGSGYGIYARLYNSSGQALESEYRVNTTTMFSQTSPRVDMNSNGEFVVCWTSDQTGDPNIYAQKYSSSGSASGIEFLVNTNTTNNQGFSDVALDDDGDFVVVWESFNEDGDMGGIYARMYEF